MFNDKFNKMLSDFEGLKQSITSNGSNRGDMSGLPVTEADQIKWNIAKQEGYEAHYMPNEDSFVWSPKPKLPVENVANVMKASGSMSPEQLTQVYPIFQWKNTNGMSKMIEAIGNDFLKGNITKARAVELVTQLCNETYNQARKETGFNESKLKPQDKVSTNELRNQILESVGGDVATESNYLKKLKAEVE
ncbi:hypothetical protein QEF67_003200 [Klebsiella aerogenes]|uniref:hypothetical protein n=1 Tax=Klebsiella aerogenes TaxID=548 RepID=UPI002A31F72F|nr:hypothetical protein [Klebsiella aerogenes]